MNTNEVLNKLIAEIERRMKDYNASIEKYYNKQKSIKAERDSWKWAECKWFLNLITSLQQEQPEMDLEKLGEIARHLIAVKDHEEDMRLDEGEWTLLERIGYPERFNARKK